MRSFVAYVNFKLAGRFCRAELLRMSWSDILLHTIGGFRNMLLPESVRL